jgi:hypothetical protein
MHPTVAAFASPFLPFIRHAKSAPSCKAKTLANAQVFRPSTAEIYPLNSTKILNKELAGEYIRPAAISKTVAQKQNPKNKPDADGLAPAHSQASGFRWIQ